jgi:hypothetical protein
MLILAWFFQCICDVALSRPSCERRAKTSQKSSKNGLKMELKSIKNSKKRDQKVGLFSDVEKVEK